MTEYSMCECIDQADNSIFEYRNDRNGRNMTKYSMCEYADQADIGFNIKIQE
jgi:hypothetical protein